MLLSWFLFLWWLFNTVTGLVLLYVICTTDANRSYTDTLLALVPGCRTVWVPPLSIFPYYSSLWREEEMKLKDQRFAWLMAFKQRTQTKPEISYYPAFNKLVL